MKVSALMFRLVAFAVLAAAGAAAFLYFRVPSQSGAAEGVITEDLRADDFKTIAAGLRIPWEIAFLPGDGLLVTERPGTIRHIDMDGKNTTIEVEGVKRVGEGGLLGLALHPDFAQNGLLYLYMTADGPGGSTRNRVERYRYKDGALSERTTILQNIPGARFHDGGELAFGPDRKLYITTGDATEPALSQSLNSLAGKILRLNDDGTIPKDNPFGTAVWSYGHRNPQGLAWDSAQRLWATEHGRSGVLSGFDELNLIEPGRNYGWPTIQGDETAEGMVAPVANSGPDETWAPSGAAHLDGKIFFSGLRGESLYQADVNSAPIVIKANFRKEFGRIRAVAVGPDGMLYFTTSNTDGRGAPREGDDKLIRVNPRLFR